MRIDYDGKWKDLIQQEPEYFVAFFLEDIYDLIDFKIPPVCIIQDVSKVIGTEKQKGDLVTDIIIKVYLKNGETRYLYIHIEVQSSDEKNFGIKMFNPFYRIRDKYQQDVTALALFVGDTIPRIYDHYEYQFGKTKVRYDFPYYICKHQDEIILKESNNPFAIAVLACIYLTKTKKNRNFEDRLALKKDLIEFIIVEAERHNFSADTISAIVSFVINLMILPKKEKQLFENHILENVLKQKDMADITVTPVLKSLVLAINKKMYGLSFEEMRVKYREEMKVKYREEMKVKYQEEMKKKLLDDRKKYQEELKALQQKTVITLFKDAQFSTSKIAATLNVKETEVTKILKKNELL